MDSGGKRIFGLHVIICNNAESSTIFEEVVVQGQGPARSRTRSPRTRTRTCKLVLVDNRGQGLSSKIATLEKPNINDDPHVLILTVMLSFSSVATTLLGSRRTANWTSSLLVSGLPTAHSTVLFHDKLHEYLLPYKRKVTGKGKQPG